MEASIRSTGQIVQRFVQLVPKARTLLVELRDDHLRNEARLFAALTVEEHTQLSGLLQKVLAGLGDTSIS